MELRQIACFMAVAEGRHFGRAAQRLDITQPALSQQIRRLERQLDVRLFARSARHARLTPAGEAFLEVARRISGQVEQARMTARRADAAEAASLDVGVHVDQIEAPLDKMALAWPVPRVLRPAG
jgi:DNA-binding transcriptional LysR family regulator